MAVFLYYSAGGPIFFLRLTVSSVAAAASSSSPPPILLWSRPTNALGGGGVREMRHEYLHASDPSPATLASPAATVGLTIKPK